MLVGNKIDLKDERQVSVQEGKDFAEQNKLIFMETSALDNQNDKIGEAFFRVITDIDNRTSLGQQKQQE